MFSVAAFLLAAVALAIPFLSSRVRSSSSLKKAVWGVLLARQFVSLLHVTVGPLPTVNKDPVAFNAFAMHAGAEHLGGNSYVQFLRGLYDALGGSHLLGCEIAQIGFSIGLVAFIEICHILRIAPVTPRLVLLFSLLPSCALNSSVVLREGLEIGAFLTFVCGFLMVRDGRFTRGVQICLVSSVLLVYLHNGFAPYVAAVTPLALLWATRSRPWLMAVAGLLGVGLIVAKGESIIATMTEQSAVMDSILEGQGLDYIGGYQSKVNEGRSAFSTTLDTSSIGALLRTGPVVTLNYLFAPFPWQVRGALDLYGILESLIRLTLTARLVSYAAKRKGLSSDQFFLFCMFLSMELVWAAGTANWGTAFRHRVVAWGLLVILGNLGEEVAKGASAVAHGRMSIRERRRALRKRRLAST